jgi:hypothetical protein
MITWITTLWLRSKLSVYMISAACLTLLIFLGAWRRSLLKRAGAEARTAALESARASERRIANKRLELSIKQRQVREELAARKERDAFSNQGWGP